METEQIVKERYELAAQRIQTIPGEDTAGEKYRPYFEQVSLFLIMVDQLKKELDGGRYRELTFEQLKEWNQKLYQDILPGNYKNSYANPAYAVRMLGEDYGQVLSFLYTEMRGAITYAFEGREEYLAVLYELFIEIYNVFEQEEPKCASVRDIIYWYASDYCDVFVADRIEEQLSPGLSFAYDIIMESNLDDIRYLYWFGEYISDNEINTARHLMALSEEKIQKMADVYTEGYRMGFINTGKDLSKKSAVNIRYVLGFERVVKKAIMNFEKMGLRPVIYRTAVSVLTKRQHIKTGYYGGNPNKQYDYDHRNDQGLFFGKRYMERKLEVIKNAYEKNKELAAGFAGPAVIEMFGEAPFSPHPKEESVKLTKRQEELSLLFDSKSGQITNQYIRGDERSFTIIAYPVPEIGEEYEKIFDEVVRINTLDAALYEKVQQTLIDALDKAACVRILGRGDNRTDLTVSLKKLQNPAKETLFENCVADVNIPVGEVFTSPVLEGTNGTLHVSRVYLDELLYEDLEIIFANGMIADYRCGNFERETDGRKYIHENLLFNHPSLPLGEFAIGTNTTAYVAAKKYGIEDKMPILIAEKMGPHFAVGDTCYSFSEDIRVYNPNGKEIIARDNSVSILRREDMTKAYFHCHTDITIPYEELLSITAVTAAGEEILLLKDGRFVLEGTEILNEPLINFNK